MGGGVLQTNIPEILEWGHSRNFEPKILVTGMCSASQIVSHILRMWGLITMIGISMNLRGVKGVWLRKGTGQELNVKCLFWSSRHSGSSLMVSPKTALKNKRP